MGHASIFFSAALVSLQSLTPHIAHLFFLLHYTQIPCHPSWPPQDICVEWWVEPYSFRWQHSAFILLCGDHRELKGHMIKFYNLITFWPSVNCPIPPWILPINVYCYLYTAAVTAHWMVYLSACNPRFYSTFHLPGVNGNRTFIPSCLETGSLLGCCTDT